MVSVMSLLLTFSPCRKHTYPGLNGIKAFLKSLIIDQESLLEIQMRLQKGETPIVSHRLRVAVCLENAR